MQNGCCWICGNVSDSGEHRLKKSDLIKRFGKGPYTGDGALIHCGRDEKMRPLQGPDSKLLKEKCLCKACNSTFTQPFDTAYEELISWAENNAQSTYQRRVINFEQVYGTDWQTKQLNLFKYFAKSFGCQLVSSQRRVPEDVVDLLFKTHFETGFYVTFSINEDHYLLSLDAQYVGINPLMEWKDRHTNEPHGYLGGRYYRWLEMHYFYMYSIQEPVGAPWRADSQFIYLGWHAPLTQEQRGQLLKLNEEFEKSKNSP